MYPSDYALTLIAVAETNVDDLIISEFASLEVRRDVFTMGRELGRGEFGVVAEATVSRAAGQTQCYTSYCHGNLLCAGITLPSRVAIKMLHERPTRQMGQSFIREAARIRQLKHENVVRLLAVHFKTNPLLIVLEFMSFGDLKSLLRQLRPRDGEEGLIGTGMYVAVTIILSSIIHHTQSICCRLVWMLFEASSTCKSASTCTVTSLRATCWSATPAWPRLGTLVRV